jgi:hypothetical protein
MSDLLQAEIRKEIANWADLEWHDVYSDEDTEVGVARSRICFLCLSEEGDTEAEVWLLRVNRKGIHDAVRPVVVPPWTIDVTRKDGTPGELRGPELGIILMAMPRETIIQSFGNEKVGLLFSAVFDDPNLRDEWEHNDYRLGVTCTLGAAGLL